VVSYGAKKVGGRKRHILVDTLGLLLKAHVHAADITDRDGAPLLLEKLAGSFPRLQHVWANMGYRGRAVDWIKAQMGWTVEIVKRPSKWGRCPVYGRANTTRNRSCEYDAGRDR
jgi:putative transposase